MRPSRPSSESPGNSSITSSTTYGRVVLGAVCVALEEHDRPTSSITQATASVRARRCTARRIWCAAGAARVKAVSRMDSPETLLMMARTEFVERSPLTRDALAFASDRHAGQTRSIDDIPFVTHPVEVACLLHEAGYSDEVVAAGVLHDVLENTDVELPELEQAFGAEVAMLVAAVSDDPSITDKAERKAALRDQVAHAGEEAAAIFAADKVSKAREL